jgi:beta-lactamase regulating signal transducer with metallopeptidase domain
MNALGVALAWCVLQVTLASLSAAVVYVVVRRVWPAAAAGLLLASMIVIVALSAISLSPWPRWPLENVAGSAHAEGTDELADSSVSAAPDHGPSAVATGGLSGLWQAIQYELNREIAGSASFDWRWPALLAALLAVGVSAGMVWLGLGIAAVRRYRRQSRAIEDADLLELVDVLRAELQCSRALELRESCALITAATIGWRRPLVLLPNDWREWTEQQRRVVIAHEIAHVCNNDFLAVMFGQLGAMMHFYHPVVHWLVNRLRLEQELTADAAAARVSGGHRVYLATIAELILRQNDRPLVWPARSFLPTRNAFLRRIAMLRDEKPRSTRVPLAAKVAAIGIVLFFGLLSAGLRGQAAKLQASDQGVAPAAPAGAVQPATMTNDLAAEPQGSVPQIVATSPAVGATDVDASTSEITVTFDRDMAEGFSWTGGGPDYPPIPEGARPSWRDRRTCVLPVKLEPGKYYRVGINSTSFQNFRSAEGVAAQPGAIYFTTRGAGAEQTAKVRAPRIVKMEPANGATDVDPARKALRVTFDMPMGDGFSWTGGGPNFPEIPEGKRPKWTTDHRTCILPVTLKPGWEYRVGLNSPSHKNFTSAGGVPLEPVVYTFKTK